MIFLILQLNGYRFPPPVVETCPPPPPYPLRFMVRFTPGYCRCSNDCDYGQNMCNFDMGNYGFCANCQNFRYFSTKRLFDANT